MAACMIRKRVFSKCFPLIFRNQCENRVCDYSLRALWRCNGNERRCYSRRTLSRNPIKIIYPDDESLAGDEDMEEQIKQLKKTSNKQRKKFPIYDERIQPKIETASQDKAADEFPLIPHYVKLGNSSIFTQAMTIAKSRKSREEHRKIVLEGKRLIKDALEAGVTPEAIFFSLEENISGLPLETLTNLKLYKVMYKQLQLWSNLTTSPGVIGVFKMPMYGEIKSTSDNKLPLTVICDNIREPGNLGAILRCVAAAGCHRILLSKGCVDVWEPKVLRSGSGAHFHIQIATNLEWELMNNYVPEDAAVYLAENTLPTDNECFAIEESQLEEANWYEVTEQGDIYKPGIEAKKRGSNKQAAAYYPITTLPYHQLKVPTHRETVLIIGGETHGLSEHCYRFAMHREGLRLAIPLLNNVDSLNSSVAAGIIIFEILRQLRAG